MKAKIILKKEIQNTKLKRTLKFGNRIRSKTTTNSKKYLTISTNENTNNTIDKKSLYKSKYNIIIFPRNQINQKIKVKDQNPKISKGKYNKKLLENNCTTKKNQNFLDDMQNPITKLPKINNRNNVTIYRKINSTSVKNILNNEQNLTVLTLKSKNKSKKHNMNLMKNIVYRTPLRIRKNGSNGGIFNKLSNENSKINLTESNLNNQIIIENLKKEINYLKEEKKYKNNIIEKMKQQVLDNNRKQEIIKENKMLKKEINILKANMKNNNNKIYNEINLFDKFKNEYINQKSKVIQLKNENTSLIKKLNIKKYINLLISKNIEIKIFGCYKQTKEIKKSDDNYNMNDYIEKRYKSELKKQNENFNDYTKYLKVKQINEIRFLIRMIFYSNKISKDTILNIIINNLINFNDIIYLLIQLIKTKSSSDKKLLKNYFTFISIDNKKGSPKIDLNNIFNEINYYFNDINKIKITFDKKFKSDDKFKKLMKGCILNDKYNNGLIELNQFNSIFEEIYGDYKMNYKLKELYDSFIAIMKYYNNLKNLDLYHLYYENLNIDKISNIDQKKINYNEDKDNKDGIIFSNTKKEDSQACSDFISGLFNDCLNEENDTNHIDNICKDFVSEVFEECIYRKNNKKLIKVCQNFVSDVFEECKERNNHPNFKVCQDFVSDVFDFCLKKAMKVKYK